MYDWSTTPPRLRDDHKNYADYDDDNDDNDYNNDDNTCAQP